MDIKFFSGVKEGEKPLDRIVTDGGFCAVFRTIAVIGDSLSSGEFESKNVHGEKGYHDYFDYSWGQFIGRSCGSKVYNFSRGGMTAKEYTESFAESNGFYDKYKLAQAYIIALGVNDLLNVNGETGDVSDIDLNDYTKNKDTFAGYYGRIIQCVKELQPKAKIFLVSIPKDGGKSDEKKKEHRDLLKKFTELFKNTYLLDLYEYSPVQDKEFRDIFWQGHMTPAGYLLMAKMIESYIDYIIRANQKDFKQVGFIGTDLYYEKKDL